MKTNKFTTQKFFCTLFFNLLVMAAFAQFTPNAAGAPDEPIPEPEVEGASCETPYYVEIEEETEITVFEDQSEVYIEFTAIADSMSFFFLRNNEPHTWFSQIDVYQKGDCGGELQLIYSESTSIFQDNISLIKLTTLVPNDNYMIVGQKEGELIESYFNFYAEATLSAPCIEEELPCGELIRNGDFSYSTSFSPSTTDAFVNNEVCDWFGLGGNPQLIYMEGSHDNNGLKISDPYAGLWSYFYPPIHPQPGRYVESIYTEVNFEATKDYYLSFTLEPSSISYLHKPHEFKVWLVNQADLDTITNPTANLPNLINKHEVVSMTANQISNNKSTYGFCFSPNSNYDRILLMTQINYSGQRSFIHIDKVSLREITAGEDVVLEVCEKAEAIQIGPDCTIPGATYSWSPTTGLSDPNIARPFTDVTTTTTYTLDVTLPGGACTPSSQVTVTVTNPVDFTLPNNTNVAQLRTIAGLSSSQSSLSDKILKVEGTLIIDEDFYFIECSFYMAEDAKILITNNSHVDFANNLLTDGEFFMPCNADKYWDGIYQDIGSRFTIGGVKLSNEPKSVYWRFHNSKNGINLTDVDRVAISAVLFKNNGRAIKVENTGTNQTHGGISLLDIRSDGPLTYDGLSFYPQHAIELINVNKQEDYFGVGHRMHPSYTNRSVVLDGTGGNLYIENSDGVYIEDVDFSGFNNYYQFPGDPDKSDKAIEVYGGDVDAKLKITNSSFVGNRESIRIQDQYSVEVSNNYVNSAGIPDASFLRATDVSNQNTMQGSNLNLIENNTILNVKKGVELYNSHYFNIRNNTFDMEVQADSTAYTKNNNEESVAIYANGYTENPYIVSNQALITDNIISHSKVGIYVNMMWTEIRDNTIKNLNNRFTVPSFCFPIQSPCPTTPSYGIRAMNSSVFIEGNTVENELNQYSGTMPNTQEEMIGISLENLGASGSINLNLYCNKTENTGIGLRFAGYNGYSDIYKNRMKNNKIGFALDNEAFIGDVGAVLAFPMQYQDAGNLWEGTFGNSHTYNFSNDDPNNPPTHYVLSGTGPTILSFHASPGYLAMTKTITPNANSVSCTAPLMVDNSSDKKEATTAYNKSGKKPRWLQKGNASDSAFYLRQQLQFYHLSKDSALYNSQQFSSFRDSMKNTALGRALGKNSQSMRSLSVQNNFDQNVSIVEPLLDKHFVDSTLSSSELDQLRQIAVLCPYTDGIAVYQARRVLHEYGERLYVNDCEVSSLPQNSQKGQPRIKDTTTQKFALNLYPNPAKDQLFFELLTDKEGAYFVELKDVLGKEVYRSKILQNNKNQIDISQMQSGVYFYRLLKNDQVMETGKFVIQ